MRLDNHMNMNGKKMQKKRLTVTSNCQTFNTIKETILVMKKHMVNKKKTNQVRKQRY